MKCLVTGAGGFLGGELVARLLAHGYTDVKCFVRPGSDVTHLAQMTEAHPGARVEFARGNVTVRADVEAAVRGVDIVFHLAAAMKGSAADMFLNTVVGTKRLLDAVAAQPGTGVVLVSSFGVYEVASLPHGALVDETTALEPTPEKRDPYSYSKWRQETLFHEYRERYGFPGVALRPGVIIGPGGAPLSARVGVSVFGVLLSLGGGNPLPVSYVTNCAEALVVAARNPSAHSVINVCDDDPPSCAGYLRRYRKEVRALRTVAVPYPAMQMVSHAVERYSRRSGGQLPAVFTPYRTASLWKGNRFSNARLKSIGWRQVVPTDEGLRRTFAYWREREARA